jgi:hypothetical protein
LEILLPHDLYLQDMLTSSRGLAVVQRPVQALAQLRLPNETNDYHCNQ